MQRSNVIRTVRDGLLIAVLSLAGCTISSTAPELPNRDPDIAGIISEARTGRILVADPAIACGVWVTIPEADKLDPASTGVIAEGRYAEVWLPVGGGIAESCPAQARAAAYRVKELKH